jgi:CRISPR-associated protein Cmr5
MSRQTIEQLRAKRALEWAQPRVDKETKSAAESFAPLILMSGLGQAAAFYKSKGGHHQRLYDLLSGWLCAPRQPFGDGNGDLLRRLVAADQSTYRAAQAEALAFLQWVKKFAKAYGEE